MSEWTFKNLQEEQVPWVLHNFGNRPSWQPLLGIAEEIGELTDAIYADSEAGIKDAIGDIVIFTADFCTAMGFDLEAIWLVSRQLVHNPPITICYGQLAHAYLKKSQGIRGNPKELDADMVGILSGLMDHAFQFATRRNWNLIEIVHETWNEVKKRDWKANAATGAIP